MAVKTVAQLALEINAFREEYDSNKAENQLQFDKIKTAINKINAHIISLTQTKPSDGLTTVQTIPTPTSIPTAVPSTGTGFFGGIYSWYSTWSSWFKFVFWIVLLIVFVQLWNSNISSYVMGWIFNRGTTQVVPQYDPASIEGVAYKAIQQNNSYKQDTASRNTFVAILDDIDAQVQTGTITDLEGYYNQFSRASQEKLQVKDYQVWRLFWNELIGYLHQKYGTTNVKTFNANLQKVKPIIQPAVSAGIDNSSQPPIILLP
jgi:hypothetical protein